MLKSKQAEIALFLDLQRRAHFENRKYRESESSVLSDHLVGDGIHGAVPSHVLMIGQVVGEAEDSMLMSGQRIREVHVEGHVPPDMFLHVG